MIAEAVPYLRLDPDADGLMLAIPDLEGARARLAGSPEDPDAWFSLGAALLRAASAVEALSHIERGLALAETSPWGLLLQSYALSALGQPQAALTVIDGLSGLGVEARVMRRRSHCLLALGRPGEALERARQAVVLDGGDPLNHVLRGWIALTENGFEEARLSMERTLDLAPSNPDGLALAARLQARAGERMAAIGSCVASISGGGGPGVQAQLVDLVEWGPLGFALGLRELGHFLLLFAGVASIRLWMEGRIATAVACVLGVVFGIYGPALLIGLASRLRIDDEVPDGWAVYRRARQDLRRAAKARRRRRAPDTRGDVEGEMS